MSSHKLTVLWLLLETICVATSFAQAPIDEKPEQLPSVSKTPEAERKRQAEEKIREAQAIFALGVMHHRGDRLLEALALLEKAAKLDPESASPRRALIPIYMGLAREDDALEACRHVIARDPADADTALQYARLLKSDNRSKEALAVLAKGLESPRLADRPELQYVMLLERATIEEKLPDYAAAETTLRALATLIRNQKNRLITRGVLGPEELPMALARTLERAGMAATQQQRYAEAIAIFQQARSYLQDQPDAETRLKAVRFAWHLAEVNFHQGNLAEALRYVDAYLEHRPADPEPYDRKMTILRKLNRGSEVLPAMRSYARALPDNVSIQLLLARELARERANRDAAEKLYLDLGERFPIEEVYRGLFRLYMVEDRMGKIIDLLDDTFRIIKSDSEVALELQEKARERGRAMLLVLRGDPELVKALLPVTLQEVARNQKRQIYTWHLLGVLAARTRQLDKAEIFFRQCLIRCPIQLEYEVYDGLLSVLHQAHKPEAVVKLCREALDGPRKAENVKAFVFHQHLAHAYAELDKFPEAIAEADNAVKYAPDTKIFQRCLRARILARADRFEPAISECEAMLKEFKFGIETRKVRYTLAIVYSMQQSFAKAEQQLRRILEEDPNDPGANNDLGYQLADRSRNLEEAERLIRKALEVDRLHRSRSGEAERDNGNYLDSLGWVLFRRGKLDEAREALEKAVQLEDGIENPIVWDHLGDVYIQLNEPGKARQAWEMALKYYPYDQRARKEGRPEATRRKLGRLPKG